MKVVVDEKVFIQTKFGPAEFISFRNLSDGREHIAIGFGSWRKSSVPKVRVHSECLTGDAFGSERCDCGAQLQEAMRSFSKSSGLVLYLRQEGRGIGLANKLRAYRLQDQGFNTYEANRALGFKDDERSFKVAAEMLQALGINKVQLLSNNPRKAQHLDENGITVVLRLFTQTHICEHNAKYLRTKNELGGHDGLALFKEREEK